MLARLAAICTLATLACAAPAVAESAHSVLYGPEVTDQLEKLLPLEIGATDCWKASFADGPATDMRFGLLVQGPAPHDDPGTFRYHYELEATLRETGKSAMAQGVCNSTDTGIVCGPECEGGSADFVKLRNGDVSVHADNIRLRYCGADGENVRISGDFHLDAQDATDCPVIVPFDDEAGVD